MLASLEKKMNDILVGVEEMNEVRNLLHAQSTLLLEKHDVLLEHVNQTNEKIDNTSQVGVNPHPPLAP